MSLLVSGSRGFLQNTGCMNFFQHPDQFPISPIGGFGKILLHIILIGDALFSCPSTDTVERISLDSLYPSQVQTRPSVHQIPARRCDPSSKQTDI
ncbi:hypothetical protein CBS63078_2152 [Aspergillus niger]|nr:hypothetical protein CBS11350_575 [Aspergillus niger]KAI2882525.1 hypothetical protein CBS13152_8868 [Aspergillus niger]KAI2894799.1 hypothetical protein CBS11852_4793 [Aspergillus niger]KAI2926850.1 hypothetical protein CBS63078_2152 [Aspergillus niger]KAI2932811.1 hypothetical protein CBS147320_1836 [Aspergillus niger]